MTTQENESVRTEFRDELPPSPVPQAPPEKAWSSPSYYEPPSRQRSPGKAAVFSLMPGLGQVYVGYYTQGFINILIVGSLIALLRTGIDAIAPLVGFFLAFFWLYNMIDANRKASRYNEALAGLGPDRLPDELEAPEPRGSLIMGVILIVIGGVALSHTLFGYSLEWIQDWWPLALLLMGAYLIYKSVVNEKTES